MDFLALYVTDFLLKLKFSKKKCAISAVIGAIYGVLSVVMKLGDGSGLLATAAVGILMCFVLNGFQGAGLLLKECAVFLSANMLIGGGMTVVYEYFNAHGGADNILIYGSSETIEAQLPLAIFIVAAAAVSVVLLFFTRGISKNVSVKRTTLRIEHHGKRLSLSALSDSGNLLTEPISGLPVIILRKRAAYRLLEPALIDLLTELRGIEGVGANERIRFIPYETVSGKGTLAAFKPDCITVNGISVSGWVAVSDKLSGKINGNDDAIVPSALVSY